MTLLALLFSVAAAASPAAAGHWICPTVTHPTISPGGAAKVRCVPRPDKQWNTPHQLVLTTKDGVERPILLFERWAEVLWSPDGRAAALVDGLGSDTTRTRIVRGPSWNVVEDVSDRAIAKLSARDRRIVEGTHHLYVHGLTWVDAHTLWFSILGWGEGGDLDRQVEARVR